MSETIGTILGAAFIFVLYAMITTLGVIGVAVLYLDLSHSYKLGKVGTALCVLSAIITPVAISYIAARVL